MTATGPTAISWDEYEALDLGALISILDGQNGPTYVYEKGEVHFPIGGDLLYTPKPDAPPPIPPA